jgi:hypothetical protein
MAMNMMNYRGIKIVSEFGQVWGKLLKSRWIWNMVVVYTYIIDMGLKN